MALPFLKTLRRILHVLAAPARVDQGRGGYVVRTFRGYGDRAAISVMGRVLHQPRFGHSVPLGTIRRDLIDVLRRILRRGVPEARVGIAAAGGGTTVTTDADGYFRAHARIEPGAWAEAWMPVEVTVDPPDDGPRQEADASVYIPPPGARHVIVSDIDDTVMLTGVANKIAMLYRLYGQSADRRMPFPGVSEFYRALHEGPGGAEGNPMLYVSRAPWSIYEMLETFFQKHEIPVGPILYLREWGVSLRSPLPRRAESHKRDLIEKMLELYQDLPFVLIGDSGQHDPEVYADVVRDFPGRVKAVYIRNVSRRTRRIDQIERLAGKLAETGSPLVLASDSTAMAEHAAEIGLISPDALPAIKRLRDVETEDPAERAEPEQPTERSGGDEEEIREHLESGGRPGEEAPPTVEIEGERGRS